MHVRTGPSRGKDARQVKLELAKLQHDLSTLLESYRVARSRVRELPHHTKKLASGGVAKPERSLPALPAAATACLRFRQAARLHAPNVGL